MQPDERPGYFGELWNLSTNRIVWSAPLGLRDLQEANERLPMCPAGARAGHVVLRRMTRSAADKLTRPIIARSYDYDLDMQTRTEVYHICGDLPVSDEYFVVQ